MNSFPRLIWSLAVCLLLGACHEEHREESAALAPESKPGVQVPEQFVLDFDVFFDLQKPWALTPEQLEKKAEAIAIVPREKLCRPVKFPQETCHYHWFSPERSPVHAPVYSIFRSSFHPNFLSVVWRDEQMERFYCVYPAEKDQEVPSQLLNDMDASLGAGRKVRTAGKSYEWELTHYRVTAEYSTHVGKGDPCFLINIRNKSYRPAPAKVAVAPVTTPADAEIPKVNLDELFDWKSTGVISADAFAASLKAAEAKIGRGFSMPRNAFRNDTSVTYEMGLSFGKSTGLNGLILGGAYAVESAAVTSYADGLKYIEYSRLREADGQSLNPLRAIARFDQIFDSPHTIDGSFHIWNVGLYLVQFFQYKGSTDYALRFQRLRSRPITPQPASAAIVQATAAALRPASPVTAAPAVTQGSSAAAAGSGTTTSKDATFSLDTLINWENPLGVKPEEIETLLKPEMNKTGQRPWHDHSDGETIFSSSQIGLTFFEGRLKMRLAVLRWNEPRVFQFEFSAASITAEDKEWARTKLDELLKVGRRKMISTNSAFTGHEWIKNGFVVRATQLEGNDFVIWIRRPQNFDPNGPAEPLAANLDALLNFSMLWGASTDGFEQLYTAKASKKEDQKKPPQFEWLNADKSRARFSRQMFSNVETKLTMFAGSVKVEEAIVEFVNGKAAKSTISFYNRGDNGDIEVKEFDRIFKTIGQNLGQVLKVSPKKQLNSTNAALPVAGWMWSSPVATALLEYNEYQVPGKLIKPEFLRLKLAAPGQSDFTMGRMVTGVQGMELIKRVQKKDGDTFISGVPMVDQGQKGYCVAASCQRLFEYMRIPCDQHEMAQLVSVDSESGANVMVMQKSLAKIDERFKVSFKALVNPEQYYTAGRKRRVSEKSFTSTVKEYVNKGVPLLWALELGRAQEEPPLPGSGQTRGGHMRMIIGYNEAKNQILFTDSWGAGHELKRMALLDAYDVTIGLYSMAPRGL